MVITPKPDERLARLASIGDVQFKTSEIALEALHSICFESNIFRRKGIAMRALVEIRNAQQGRRIDYVQGTATTSAD